MTVQELRQELATWDGDMLVCNFDGDVLVAVEPSEEAVVPALALFFGEDDR